MSAPAGIVAKWKRAVRRIGTFADQTVLVYRSGAHTDVESPVRIGVISAENVGDALAMDPPDRIAEYRSFLARGDVGYFAYREGRVVHRSWVRFGPVRAPLWHSYGSIAVPSGEGYIHYCETHPSARGLRIYPAVLGTIVKRQTGRCPGGFVIVTTLDNDPSRRGIEAAGFSPHRVIRLKVAFGWGVQREGRRLPPLSTPVPGGP